MDELTREFLVEHQEGLERMERCLTELEESPQEKPSLPEYFEPVVAQSTCDYRPLPNPPRA